MRTYVHWDILETTSALDRFHFEDTCKAVLILGKQKRQKGGGVLERNTLFVKTSELRMSEEIRLQRIVIMTLKCNVHKSTLRTRK